MPTITITDQTTSGTTTAELTLDLLTEQITVRELIHSRVYQEVQDFNRQQQVESSAPFRSLVQPTNTEATLNGYEFRLKSPRQIDWKPQFEKASGYLDCKTAAFHCVEWHARRNRIRI